VGNRTLKIAEPRILKEMVRLDHPLLPDITRITPERIEGVLPPTRVSMERTLSLLTGLAHFGFHFSEKAFRELPTFPDLTTDASGNLVEIESGRRIQADPWSLQAHISGLLRSRWSSIPESIDLIAFARRRKITQPTTRLYIPESWEKGSESHILIPSHPGPGLSTAARWTRHRISLSDETPWIVLDFTRCSSSGWDCLLDLLGIPDGASLEEVKKKVARDFHGHGIHLDHIDRVDPASRNLLDSLILSLPDILPASIITGWDRERLDGFAWRPLPVVSWEEMHRHLHFPHLTPVEQLFLHPDPGKKRASPAAFCLAVSGESPGTDSKDLHAYTLEVSPEEIDLALADQNALTLLAALPALDVRQDAESIHTLAASLSGDIDTLSHVLDQSDNPGRLLSHALFCALEGDNIQRIEPYLRTMPDGGARRLLQARLAFREGKIEDYLKRLESVWEEESGPVHLLAGLYLADRRDRPELRARVREEALRLEPSLSSWHRSQVSRFIGSWDLDHDALKRWLDTALARGWLSQAALAYSDLASLAAAGKDWPTAQRNLESALRYRSALGASASRSLLLHNLGSVQIHLERWDRALSIFEELESEHRESGTPWDLLYDLLQKVKIFIARGMFDKASTPLDEAESLLAEMEDHPLACHVSLFRVILEKWRGNLNLDTLRNLKPDPKDPDTISDLEDLKWQAAVRAGKSVPAPSGEPKKLEWVLKKKGWEAVIRLFSDYLSREPAKASILLCDLRCAYSHLGSPPEHLVERAREHQIRSGRLGYLRWLEEPLHAEAWNILNALKSGEPFDDAMPKGISRIPGESNDRVRIPSPRGGLSIEPGIYYRYPEEFWNLAVDYLPDPRSESPDRESSGTWHGMAYASPVTTRLVNEARPIADLPLPILIRGETGTGKEILADAIHREGGADGRPFQVLNCASIPSELFESELFGHRRGAFTGAVADKPGLVELADGGTLFLDEIGELPPEAQAKLLRILNDHTVYRVGDYRPIHVNFRLISATHRDLETMVSEGTFREDLYYRINGLTFHVPPLRERREEIPMFVRLFLDRFCEDCGLSYKEVDPGATNLLLAHEWPGNIRELRQVVQAAAARARDREEIGPQDLPDSLQENSPYRGSFHEGVDRAIREIVVDALARAGGNRRKAAKLLGITPQALGYQVRRLKITG